MGYLKASDLKRCQRGCDELDSKSCRSGVWLTAETVGITGFLGISTLFYSFTSTDFLRFLRKVRSLWWVGKALQLNRQRYRRGHNEPDSKSGCRQLHVGSNPTRCANQAPDHQRGRGLDFLETLVTQQFGGRTYSPCSFPTFCPTMRKNAKIIICRNEISHEKSHNMRGPIPRLFQKTAVISVYLIIHRAPL